MRENDDRDETESLFLGETCKYFINLFDLTFPISIAAYLKELHKTDRDNYEKLLHICKHVQDNQVDFRKFKTLRTTVLTFCD